MESTIAQDLRNLAESNGIAVLEFRRTITADSDEDVRAGQVEAREWLKESGAQVLIGGSHRGQSVDRAGRAECPRAALDQLSNLQAIGAEYLLLNTAGGIQSLRRLPRG